MKTLTLTAAALCTLAFTLPAHASWMQGFCANGEATVRTASGHNENFVQLTRRVFGSDGAKDTVIRDEEGKLAARETETAEIANEVHRSCRPGEKLGWYSSRRVTATKLLVTNEDGSAFDKDVVGVSDDRKTVEANLICEMRITSQMLCQQ